MRGCFKTAGDWLILRSSAEQNVPVPFSEGGFEADSEPPATTV